MRILSAALAAFLGGVAGSGSRQLVALSVAAAGGPDVIARMSVNVVGGLLAGIYLARREAEPARWDRLEPLVAAGFLGGLTTVASYALDAAKAFETADGGALASLVAVDGVLGLLAAALGHRLARGVVSPVH